MTRRPAIVVQTSGLHKSTGLWAECYGLFNPVVCIDPAIGERKGARALVEHEMCHARERHRLVQIVAALCGLLCLAAGAFVLTGGVEGDRGALNPSAVLAACLLGVFGLANLAVFAGSRRTSESEADAAALRATSREEFVAFLFLHPTPKSRWGKWVYGATRTERLNRALRLLKGD